MADQKRWFKLWCSAPSDDDLQILDPATRWAWAAFGCYTKEHGTKGKVKISSSNTSLAAHMGVTVDALFSTIKTLPHMTFEEGKNRNGELTVTWHNWVKYQEDTTQAARQQTSRSKRRGEEKRGEEIIYSPKNSNGFDVFWENYPSKIGKGAALKKWQQLKISSELLAKILDAVEKQKKSSKWTKNNGEYIPNPTTWLNQGRWDDEVEVTEKLDDPWHKYE